MARTIGRYELISEIGKGGMATVYLAHDPYIKREVALKVMSQVLMADTESRGRFEQEAQAIAALESPNIVPIYDFGYDNDRPYIVMRSMNGGSLKEKLNISGPLEVREASVIVERMAEALDEAHRRGIIHRDVKPHNMLIDGKGGVFLSDFGLVKMLSTEQKFTSGEFILGTPAYVSPEQVYGQREIDHRVDIYAMGVSLFEMLAGRRPFEGENPTAVMMKHVTEAVPMLTELLPDTTPEVEAVVAKALAKDPDARFQTAGEMAAALNATSGWWGPLSRKATRKLGGDTDNFSFGAIKKGELPDTQEPGSPLGEG